MSKTSEIIAYYYQPNISNHRLRFLLSCSFAFFFFYIANNNQFAITLPNDILINAYWVNLSCLTFAVFLSVFALRQIKAAFLRKVPKRRLIIQADRILTPLNGKSSDKITIKFENLIDKQVVRFANRQYLKLKSPDFEWHIYEAGFNDQQHFDHMVLMLDHTIGKYVEQIKSKKKKTHLLKLKPKTI